MSADKLQAVREALADVFNEANLNATGTPTAGTSFDESLSEAFSKPQLNSANAEQSFARFDHADLTGLFSQPRSERPSPTNFDQAFSQLLSGRSAESSDTQSPRPGFDHQAFAEILSEPSPVSTSTNPTQPSFDHQALAEMLSEARADPINPPTSTLRFNTDSLSSAAPYSDRGEHEEPVAKALTASFPADAESARPPIAKSLLAKLHHMFSTREEPSLSDAEKGKSPQPLIGQSSRPEATSTYVSIQPEPALTHPAGSARANLPPFSLEQKPVSPHIPNEPVDERPLANDVIVSPPGDAVGTWLPPESSLPNEKISPLPTDTKSSSPNIERYSSTPTAAQQLNIANREAETSAAAAPPETGGATDQQTRSLLIESGPRDSNDLGPVFSSFGEVQSVSLLSGSLDLQNAPDADEVLQPEAEPPPLILSMPTGSKAASSQPVLCDQSDRPSPAQDVVSTAAPFEAENARSQLAKSTLAGPTFPVSTEDPSSHHLGPEPSPENFSGQSQDMTSAATPVAPSSPTNVESARPQRLRRLLAELSPAVSTDLTPPLATTGREPSLAACSTHAEDPQPATKPASPSEGAVQPWVTERLLGEILSQASVNAESKPVMIENGALPIPLSDQLENTAPAIESVAAAPAVYAATEQLTSLPPIDLPAIITADTPASGEPVVESFVTIPNEAENASPQHESPLLTALRVLSTKPSPPLLEKKLSASTAASQPDKAEMSVELIAHPTDVESASAYPPKSPMPAMPSTASFSANFSTPVFEEERQRPPVSDQPPNDTTSTTMPLAGVASTTDADGVVTRAQQATSLLDELDLNTAIQLRWTMRDIRGKRTKFSPVSDNHLTVLMNLGLVEVRDGLPRLTGLGVLALD